MTSRQNQYSTQFKFRVTLEANRGHQTISQIAGQNNVHPNLVSNWKKQLLKEGADVFKTQAKQPGPAQVLLLSFGSGFERDFSVLSSQGFYPACS